MDDSKTNDVSEPDGKDVKRNIGPAILDDERDEDEEDEEHNSNDLTVTVAAANQVSNDLNKLALMNELESNYVNVRNERDNIRSRYDEQTTQIASLQKTLQELEMKFNSKEQELIKSKAVIESQNSWRKHAEEQTKLNEERIDRMALEADSLRDEISKVNNRNLELSREIDEYQSSTNEAASSAIPLRYEKERLQKQVESITAHSQWLEKELSNRTDELSTNQQKHVAEIHDLKLSNERTKSEKESLQIDCKLLKEKKNEFQQSIENLHQQIKELTHNNADAKKLAEEDILAERKVSSLLEEKCARLQEKCEDAYRTINDMKDIAKKASEEDEVNKKKMLASAEEEIEDALQKAIELEKALKEMEKKKQMAEKALQEKHDSEIRKRKRMHETLQAFSNGKGAVNANNAIVVHESSASTDQSNDTTSDLQVVPTPISLTDLYACLSETEDELNFTKTENKRLSLYLQKICTEMESSAPKIRQQQQEYHMALKERDTLQKRLQEALAKAHSSNREAEDLAVDLNDAAKEVKELRIENKDLAKQIQILLESRIGTDMKDSNDPIGFTTIEELQQQNQKLIREHHRLEEKVSELQTKLNESSLQDSLIIAEQELEEMREERSRQTTLVAGIVQQRDLYRALLAKNDNKLLLEAEHQPPPEKKEEKQHEQEISKLRAELLTTKNAASASEERILRLDSHISTLTADMEKINVELSSANANTARNQAEAKYFSEKCTRLEEAIKDLQNELVNSEGTASEMQLVNVNLQKTVSETAIKIKDYERQLNMLKANNNLLEAQLKTAKAAEERLLTESNSLNAEISRRGALLDSVQRIEASLSARSANEMQVLEKKIEKMEESAKVIQSKHADELEAQQNKVSSMEISITSLQKARDDALSESVQAKDESLRLQTQIKFLEGKSNKLESDLENATQKLKELQPNLSDIESSDKQKILSLSEEMNTIKEELRIARERVKTYQEISKKTEKDLADLTAATTQYKEEKTTTIEELQKKFDICKKDADAKQAALVDLGKDLAMQQTERKESESILKTKITTLEEDVKNLEKNNESSKERLNELSAEIDLYRDTALKAQQNYERELELHSAARTELRTVRSKLDVEIHQREITESNHKALQFESNEKQKLWDDEKSKLEEIEKEQIKRLQEAQEQNKLLHNQMNSLTETVEKFQSDRIEFAATDQTGDKDCSNDQTKMNADDYEDKMNKLNKSISELREVIRFMRSEREILDAQLDTLRRTAERERATSSVAKRSLDEARVELDILQKRFKESNQSPIIESDKENKNAQKEANEQLILLRDSNTLLREESERLRAKLDSANKSLDLSKKSIGPLELKMRGLETDLIAAESEKASLTRQIESWKNRMQNFVSKFQMIDPEDYEKAVSAVESAKKEIGDVKMLKEKAEKDCDNAKTIIIRLNKEISNFKVSIKEMDEKLAKALTEKDELIKSHDEGAKKELDELKVKIKKVEAELGSAKFELNTKESRVVNLTNMLKKFKNMIAESNKKNQLSLANELEAKKALVKEQAAHNSLKEEMQKVQQSANKATGTVAQAVVNDIPERTNVTESATPSTPTVVTESQNTAAKKTSNVTIDLNPKDEKNDKNKAPSAQEALSDSGVTASSSSVDVPTGGFKFAASVVDNTSSSDSTDKSKSNTKDTPAPSIENPTTVDKVSDILAKPAKKKAKTMKGGSSLASATKPTKIVSVSSPKDLNPVTSEVKTEASSTSDINSLRAKLLDRKRKLNKLKETPSVTQDSKDTNSGQTPDTKPSKKQLSVSEKNLEKKTDIKQTPAVPVASNEQSLEVKEKVAESKIEKVPLSSEPFGSKFGTIATTNTNSSGTFLNLKPPGSSPSSTNFTFGSSSSIKLPMPSKTLVPTAKMSFGVFGSGSTSTTSKSPFGSSVSSSTSIFGNSGKKRPSSPEQVINVSKQARKEGSEKDGIQAEEEKNKTEKEDIKDST